MKLNLFTSRQYVLPLLLLLAISIGLLSWDYDPSPRHHKTGFRDTIPKKSITTDKKIRDLDDVIDQLDQADFQVDMKKMQKELAEAMEKLNSDQTRMQVEKALQEVDWEKMKKEMEASIASIDFDKIKNQLHEAIQQADMAKIQQDVQASLQKIDWEKMKKDLEKAKEIDLSKITEELKKMKPELEKSMEKARGQIAEAKTSMKSYREFINGLENDGLLTKKEGYKIKHLAGELEINGKKVPASIYNKYRDFLEKHKKFTIEKTNDDFNIEMD